MTFDRKVLLSLIHSLMVDADVYGSGDTYGACVQALELLEEIYSEDECPHYINDSGTEAEYANEGEIDLDNPDFDEWRYMEYYEKLLWWCEQRGVNGIFSVRKSGEHSE